MAGLLDSLFGGNGTGGLLSYLQSPLYQSPLLSDDQQFKAALRSGADGVPDITPQDIWSQPGITYSPYVAPQQNVFASGAAPIFGTSAVSSVAPQPVASAQSQQSSISAPSVVPAPPVPPQASPIDIGNYQMPRIGSADLYSPQQANLPANSVPAQGQIQQATQPTEGVPQTSLPSFLSNQGGLGAGLSGFVNNLHTGPLGAIVGGIGSALGLQNPAQQNLRAQYEATSQALIANGLSPQQARSTAMLSVLNPEAAKTVLPELLTNKEKYGVISEDPLEGKKYGFINERDQTVNGKPIGQGGVSSADQIPGLQGTLDRLNAMKAQGATKQQLIDALPNGYREDVDALVSGKAVPSNMGRAALRGPLNILAHAVDGNYDETQIPGRIQMRKDFMGEGKNGLAIGSFNTTQHHVEKLSNDLETLAKFHGNFPAFNSMKDWLSANVNSNPELRDTVQSVRTDMAAVSHEMANAYNAGHLSDHDMATWNALTNSNLPPDQLRRGLADFVDLLNGKRDSLNHMYRQQFGEDAPGIEKTKNEDITKLVHQRSPNYAGDNQSSAAPSGIPAGWTVKVR